MEYKLIVAGGRDFADYDLLSAELFALAENAPEGVERIAIVCGMARGADALGYQFARNESATVYKFPADWDTHGKAAGYKRNQQMAEFSDGLLAFWNGSNGTAHMIKCMERLNKPVRIVRY